MFSFSFIFLLIHEAAVCMCVCVLACVCMCFLNLSPETMEKIKENSKKNQLTHFFQRRLQSHYRGFTTETV